MTTPGVIVRDGSSEKRHIIIIGQPRSGTVAFWKTFRQDRRLHCLNEPFHPLIRHHVENRVDSHKETMAEHLGIADLIRTHWSTIQPYEETYHDLVSHQETFLRKLLDTSEHTCLKVIRCCSKIAKLREVAPDALIIHLVRDPRAWVTSHLRPYGKWLPGLPGAFFEHTGWFDFWSRQQIARHLNLQGRSHEQLLQIWNMFTAAAEAARPDVTVQFESFATNPERVIRTAYDQLGIEYRPLDFGMIHPPNAPYALESPEWERALRRHLSDQTRPFVFPFSRAVRRTAKGGSENRTAA